VLDDFVLAVEEEVLLGREVVEHGGHADLGGLGHGHLVEPPRGEQAHRGLGDESPGTGLLSFPKSARGGCDGMKLPRTCC
jgi:hypothetical protein